jgi:hypothetical protein
MDNFFKGIDSIGVGYVKIGNEEARVASIMMDQHLPREDAGRVDERRKGLVSRYGVPTVWLKWISNGTLNDRALYTSFPGDQNRVEDARGCLSRWQCMAFMDNKDCRQILRDTNGPALSIAYYDWGVSYMWNDLQTSRRSLRQSREFTGMNIVGTVCPVVPVH